MTDGDALYRAILAAPADDTPRLVYADWLDEHGRAVEAEFVRLGCGLDAGGPDHPAYADRVARQEELRLWLTEHVPGPEPTFPAGLTLGDGVGWWRLTGRGFPLYLAFSGDGRPGLKPIRALAAALEQAFATVPARMLVLQYVTAEQLAEFVRHPVVERLDALSLNLYYGDPHEDAAGVVAAAPRLGNLRELNLYFDPGEAGHLALAGSPHLGRVERLALGSDGPSPAAVRALAGAGWFRDLRSLTVHDLPAGSLAELGRAGPFPRLHTLHLRGGGSGNQVPVAGWQGFARSAAFPALAGLGLGNSDLSGGRAAGLFEGRWPRLAHLDLSYCAVGNDGAAGLAAAPWLGGVRWLDLRANLLTPAGVAAVAGSPAVAGLRHLDLSHNTLGPGGLKAVARNPALRALRTLILAGDPEFDQRLTAAHLHAFLSALDLPDLRHLVLNELPVGDRAARLLTADRFRSLTRLGLHECGVSDATAAALRDALPDLVEFVV
jgi:uncharacterized protein (TIGR02996 family)